MAKTKKISKQSKKRLANGKSLGGKKKSTVKEKLAKRPHNFNEVVLLYTLGLTDEQVSKLLGISVPTLYRWKLDPEFSEAVMQGKEYADCQVKASLFKRAMGYEYDEVTYEKTRTGGLGIKMKKGEIKSLKHCKTSKTKIVTKQIAGDVSAQQFWLTNRQKEDWRHRQDHEHSAAPTFAEIIKSISGNKNGKAK